MMWSLFQLTNTGFVFPPGSLGFLALSVPLIPDEHKVTWPRDPLQRAICLLATGHVVEFFNLILFSLNHVFFFLTVESFNVSLQL